MATPEIIFTDHAMVKFEALAALGIQLDERMVADAVRNPMSVSHGYGSRMVAQVGLDDEKVLRVVYEQIDEEIIIVTFYPGRRSRYE